MKDNILYSRARTAPPAHQTSNKCGYRPIKNKREGREEERGGNIFLTQFYGSAYYKEQLKLSLLCSLGSPPPLSVISAHSCRDGAGRRDELGERVA